MDDTKGYNFKINFLQNKIKKINLKKKIKKILKKQTQKNEV